MPGQGSGNRQPNSRGYQGNGHPQNQVRIRALIFSSLLHWIAFGFLVWVYFAFELNLIYATAVLVIGVLLVVEHRLINPRDLSRLQIAFFHINSAISVILLAGIALDCLIAALD